MKDLPIKIGVCVLALITILSAVYFASRISKNETTEGISLSYFEDTEGHMDISNIENADLARRFIRTAGEDFKFGRSHSTF